MDPLGLILGHVAAAVDFAPRLHDRLHGVFRKAEHERGSCGCFEDCAAPRPYVHTWAEDLSNFRTRRPKHLWRPIERLRKSRAYSAIYLYINKESLGNSIYSILIIPTPIFCERTPIIFWRAAWPQHRGEVELKACDLILRRSRPYMEFKRFGARSGLEFRAWG